MQNQPYYLDSEGNNRRVDNGHKVLIHTVHHGEWVDLDLKTGQILRDYAQEDRDKRDKYEKEVKEKNRKEKEKAIKAGRKWYSAYEINPLISQSRFPYNYHYVQRSVDRDVKLYSKSVPQILKDDVYGFIIWAKDFDKPFSEVVTQNGIDAVKYYDTKLEYYKVRNWRIIKGEWWHEHYGKTEQELEEYARSIGALL